MIICVSEFVISFLIPLENEGQEKMFAQKLDRRPGGTKHFSYNFYTYTDPFIQN